MEPKKELMYQPESIKGEIIPHTSKNFLIKFLVKRFNDLIYYFIRPLNINTVFDVGCGEGYIINYIRKKNPNLKFKGIDIMEKNLKKARVLNPGIEFEHVDFLKEKYKPNSFDLILCTEVLEHLNNPEEAVKKLRKICKKYYLVSVPNEPFWRIANIIRLAHLKTLGNTPHHLNNWTKNQFKRFLQRYFSEVNVRTSSVWTVALCKK